MKVKNFSLHDQSTTIHTLKQYRGKWVVLYFYPKDDTPGCTIEACTFRDSLAELQKRGVVILGVSKDSVASHKKFADKYHLNFPILSDESKETIKAYDAWGGLGTRRITYLIDPKGDIHKIYKNVNPTIHAGEILPDLKEYEQRN